MDSKQTTSDSAAEARGAPDSPSCAEFSVKPQAVIVHDPVAAGALEFMTAFDDPAMLEERTLFRSRPEANLYGRQHRAFVRLLRRHVSQVVYLREAIGDDRFFSQAVSNPNQVFTRDSLITIPWIPNGYIKARMNKPVRRRESEAMEKAVKAMGLTEVVRIPQHLFIEGGDVIPFSREGKRTLLIGHGPRTCREVLPFLQETLVPGHVDEIIGIELAPWRLNLDGGFLPVAGDLVITDTGSILGGTLWDVRSRREIDVFEMVRDLGVTVIEVTRQESIHAQACNCVCLGERRIICYDLSPRVRRLLVDHGMQVHAIAGSELVKGRGGPRCMTRPIYTKPKQTRSRVQ